jgi:hypothetical protein
MTWFQLLAWLCLTFSVVEQEEAMPWTEVFRATVKYQHFYTLRGRHIRCCHALHLRR